MFSSFRRPRGRRASGIASHLTYANVVSSVAVFLALSGTAYAIGLIPGDTIQPRSIPGDRMRLNALTGREINERSLESVQPALRWALVDVSGEILAQSGGITTKYAKDGVYVLDFNSDVMARPVFALSNLRAATFAAAPCAREPTDPGAIGCDVPAGANDGQHVAISSIALTGRAEPNRFWVAVG